MSSSIQNVTGNDKLFFNETQTLLFESKLSPVFPGVENPATVAYCNIHRIYVETAVNCVEDVSSIRKPQCYVTAVRESQAKHQPSDITPFLFPSILSQFSTSLAHSQGQQRGRGSYSLTEKYLNNTDAPLLVQDFGMRLFNLDKEVFSQRLTQVINTYYIASLFPSAMVGGLDTQLPTYTVSQYTSAPIKRATTGTVTSLQNHLYSTNIAWLTVFLVTSTVMLAAATTSSVLAYFTAIPDVLGYASSLTRDSAYFPHSSTKGSVLDGLTRSRKLKDQKVKLGDVRCNERIGLLAFSEADAAVRAEKKKLYQ